MQTGFKDLSPYVNSTVYKKSMYITSINKDVRYSMIQKGCAHHSISTQPHEKRSVVYLFCPEDWQIEAPIRYKVHENKENDYSRCKVPG